MRPGQRCVAYSCYADQPVHPVRVKRHEQCRGFDLPRSIRGHSAAGAGYPRSIVSVSIDSVGGVSDRLPGGQDYELFVQGVVASQALWALRGEREWVTIVLKGCAVMPVWLSYEEAAEFRLGPHRPVEPRSLSLMELLVAWPDNVRSEVALLGIGSSMRDDLRAVSMKRLIADVCALMREGQG